MSDPNTLTTLVAELEEKATLETVRQQLDGGESPKAVLDALNNGMNIVGERFAVKEYFLVELVMAAEILKQTM